MLLLAYNSNNIEFTRGVHSAQVPHLEHSPRVRGGRIAVAQQQIETILCRHWASHLQTPVFLVDPEGNLLFYNEPAELILGRRFAETGLMSAAEWSTAFRATDDNDNPVNPEELPLSVAIAKRQPAHKRFWIVGLDNDRRFIETTALPLIGQSGRFLGAVAFFWELND